MDRRIGWSDVSYRHTKAGEAESWVPAARILLYHNSSITEQDISISTEEQNRIGKGEILYPTQAKARAKINELIVDSSGKWNVPCEEIQEYQCSLGHAFLFA